MDIELPQTSPPLDFKRCVDSTPDAGLPIRILQAYRDECRCKYIVEGLPPARMNFWELMNQWQDDRARILDHAIALLKAMGKEIT